MTTDNAQDPASRGSSWFHEASVGVLRGITVAVTLFGLSIFVFSGSLSSYVLQGLGIFIGGGVVVTLFLAFVKSSPPRLLYIPIPFAIALALLVQSNIEGVDNAFVFFVISVMVAAILVGVVLLLLSWLRIARFLTYLPSTVVASVYMAAGTVLVMFVIRSLDVNWGLASSNINLLAILVTAITLPWTVSSQSPRWLRAGVIILLCLLFHVTLLIFNVSTTEAISAGSFLEFETAEPIWPPVTFADFSSFSWYAVYGNIGAYLGPVLVFIIVAIGGFVRLDNNSQSTVDWDRQLSMHGLANCLAGLLATTPGSVDTSQSARFDDSKRSTRTEIPCTLIGLILVAVFSEHILPLVPIPVAIGVILVLGIEMLWRSSAFASDYQNERVSRYWDTLTLLLVLFVTIAYGFYAGIVAGLLSTITSMVYRSGKFGVEQLSYTIADRSSSVLRSIPDQAILKVYGSKTNIYKMQGYAEYGSMKAFVQTIRDSWDARSKPSCLVVDMADVQGFDEAALDAFVAFLQFAKQADVQTILSAIPEGFRYDTRGRQMASSIDGLVWVDNEEEALIQSEEIILEDYRKQSEAEPGLRDLVLRSVTPELTGYLERQIEFESIVEEISEFGTTTEFEDQGDIVKIGDAQTGVHLVLAGKASLKTPEGVTLREFELGNPIALTNLIEPKSATLSVVAEGSCRTLLVDRETVTRLEEENAQLAVRLYKYLLTAGGEARATN